MNEKNYKKDIIKNEEVKKPKYESLSEESFDVLDYYMNDRSNVHKRKS